MNERNEADELIGSLGLCIAEKREYGMDSNQSPRDLVLSSLADIASALRKQPDTVDGAFAVAELITYSGQALMTMFSHPNVRKRYGS